jgi:hypothetical protein
MSKRSPKPAVIRTLLDRHGKTYADDLGIRLERNTPSVLFRWLCASMLLGARIRADIAVAAARALSDRGWTTAQKMEAATWAERTRILNQAGYARYDESTSRMLGDTSALLLKDYGGDLRKLRDAAEKDPSQERILLKECKGLGDVGVDIFFREAQGAWRELQPFLDKRALKAASALGLPEDAKVLSRAVGQDELPRLGAALVRMALAKDADLVLADARG